MRRPALSLVLGAALVFALFGAVVFGTQSSEAGQAQRSRVIDRTLLCSVPIHAGIRQVRIIGNAGVRDQADASMWFRLSHASLNTGNSGLVGIQAGAPMPSPSISTQPTWTLWIYTNLCKPLSRRVRLSPGRLGGGPASQLLERYECPAARSIIVRIRGEFRVPTTLRNGRWTQAAVRAGSLVAMTPSGRPLIYAEAFESGKARIFTAANCVRD
jgi:hypothetical protein